MTDLSRRKFFGLSGLAVAAAAITYTPAKIATARAGGSYASLADFGGQPYNTSFDNTPAFNAALAARVTNLYIPPGAWSFLTRPAPVDYSMEIVGEGFGISTLIRRYVETNNTNGLLTLSNGNIRVLRLGVQIGSGYFGGSGVTVISDGTHNPGYTVLEDLYVSVAPTENGRWYNAVCLDGVQNPAAPLGVRAITLRNCFLFASTSAACRINGGVSISISGGGMFPAGGTTGRLLITGSAAVNSYYVQADVPFIGGLYLDNCQYVSIDCAVIAGDITNAGTAKDVLVKGHCTGVVSHFWTRGRLIDPGVPGS